MAITQETHLGQPSTKFNAPSYTTSPIQNSATMEVIKRGWVAPFLLHLHQLLRRESPEVIRWTGDGKAFEILDKEAMTHLILPQYFRNKNFASFQRQLNYFGFRKWSKGRSVYPTYSRQYFTRDRMEDLVLVKRQSKVSSKDSKKNKPIHSASSSSSENDKSDLEVDTDSYQCRAPTNYERIAQNVWANIPVIMENGLQSPNSVSEIKLISYFPKLPSISFDQSIPRANGHTVPLLSASRKTTVGIRLPSIHQLTPWAHDSYSDSVSSVTSDVSESLYGVRVDISDKSRVSYAVKELNSLSASKFIRGLYDMICSDVEGRGINWSNDGQSFRILDTNLLATEFLPKYFKHCKYRSFQQQLNMYGFEKWSKAISSVCTYSHELFHRDNFTNLCRIARKTSLN